MDKFTKDFRFGGAAGILTGPAIAWLEVIKVNTQTNRFLNLKFPDKLKLIIKETFKMTPQFSFGFGLVCAIEFSVNQRIKQIYGDFPALLASAFTGSMLLTPVEHIICISSIKKTKLLDSIKIGTNSGFFRLWTGMSSMVIRESFFIFNLFFAGQNIGKRLQEKFGSNDFESERNWRIVGRLLCGMLTTTASHPFDAMSRKMQILALENPKVKPSLVKALSTSSLKESFSGLVPRLIIANVGGVTAAYLFEMFHYKSNRRHI